MKGKTEGYMLTFEDVETGETYTDVAHVTHRLFASIGNSRSFRKSAEEAMVGMEFEGLSNFIDAPLEGLETILDKSPTYHEAKRAVHIVNNEGRAIPVTRYHLIQGIGPELGIEVTEEKLLKEGDDFTREEMRLMGDHLFKLLKGHCEENDLTMVKPDTVEIQYLKGRSVFPGEWDYFSLFATINPAFEEFTKGYSIERGGGKRVVTITPGSKAYYYDVYTGKRRLIRQRLEHIKRKIVEGHANGIQFDAERIVFDREYRVDIVPELRLLFQHFDGKSSQYVRLRLTEKEPLDRRTYRAESRKDRSKQRYGILKNNLPTNAPVKGFDDIPLCCVNGLLEGIFLYSVLTYFKDNLGGLPHRAVNEIANIALYERGVKNDVTSSIVEYERHRRPELFDMAKQLEGAIGHGEFDSLFNLAPGEFIGFYDVFRRTSNALTRKYWNVLGVQYRQHNHPIRVSATFDADDPMGHANAREEVYARAQETGKQLKEEFDAATREIFPRGHSSRVLPWYLILKPFLIPFSGDRDRIDIVRGIEDAAQMQQLIGYISQGEHMERYSQDQVTTILDELSLSGVASIVHENNFLGAQDGSLPGK